jgi:hypothetical protein
LIADRTPAHRLRIAIALSAMAVAIAALSPARSSATITFGSDLKSPLSGIIDDCLLTDGSCTHLLTGVHRGNEFPAASPTDGVVVKFGIKSAAGDSVTFRLGRLSSDFRAKGAGFGSVELLPGAGTYSFPAYTPIRAGDYVGVDSSSVSAASSACGGGARWFAYFPPLDDGGPFQDPAYNSTCELLVNATVRPSSHFKLEEVERNEGRGTATLALDLPGPGNLKLSGKGVKPRSTHAAEAGKAKLPIKPRGKVKRRLGSRGEAKVKVEVTFKPEGGASRTKSKRVKLIER